MRSDSPPARGARAWRNIRFALALALPAGSPAFAGPAISSVSVQNGIAVEFSLLAGGTEKSEADGVKEGQNATFRFRISNADSHSPLKDASPAAWVARQAGQPRTSLEKAAPFLGGGNVMRQADLDLNA